MVISLSVTACYDDKDDADDNRYEVGTNCDCADIVAMLTTKIEEMEAQLEEYKSEIVSIQTQLNNFSGGGQALPQLAKADVEIRASYNDVGAGRYNNFEYDNDGRLIKIIMGSSPLIGQPTPSSTFNVLYSGNKCIIKSNYENTEITYTLTFGEEEIDNIGDVNYLIISYICDLEM